MSSDVLRLIERNIQQQKKLVEMGEALERLKSNRDFKRLIIDGYFEKEAVRLVHARSAPNMQSPESQESINKQIDAIGSLYQYFTTVEQLAAMARKSISVDEETRDELIQEGIA